MPLPETVPVRFTEEEAEYISVRPVRRQTFRVEELIDMVLTVTGKNLSRIQQILHSGTVVYNFYRYWWPAMEADPAELAALLARFPDSDPARAFRAEDCTAVLMESGGQPPRHSLEFDRASHSRKRLLRSRSFWDCLVELGRAKPPSYEAYSYARRADLYRRAISHEEIAGLVRDALRFARRNQRVGMHYLPEATRMVFVCPRRTSSGS